MLWALADLVQQDFVSVNLYAYASKNWIVRRSLINLLFSITV